MNALFINDTSLDILRQYFSRTTINFARIKIEEEILEYLNSDVYRELIYKTSPQYICDIYSLSKINEFESKKNRLYPYIKTHIYHLKSQKLKQKSININMKKDMLIKYILNGNIIIHKHNNNLLCHILGTKYIKNEINQYSDNIINVYFEQMIEQVFYSPKQIWNTNNYIQTKYYNYVSRKHKSHIQNLKRAQIVERYIFGNNKEIEGIISSYL